MFGWIHEWLRKKISTIFTHTMPNDGFCDHPQSSARGIKYAKIFGYVSSSADVPGRVFRKRPSRLAPMGEDLLSAAHLQHFRGNSSRGDTQTCLIVDRLKKPPSHEVLSSLILSVCLFQGLHLEAGLPGRRLSCAAGLHIRSPPLFLHIIAIVQPLAILARAHGVL